MKKKMSLLVALGISTAVFCGIWSALATAFGLLGWAGFAGCTTYFSTGSHGWLGLRRTLLTNIVGVLCGIACFLLTDWIPALGTWGVWCAIITFIMCIVSYFNLLDFCPGIFMGCFSTFAAGGDWKVLLPSIIAGAVLGVLCDKGGVYLHKFMTRKNK